jgi:hypothetical protein
MYAWKRKSSTHVSATVFQNGGSACTVLVELSWFWVWKTGHCVFHISKSGRVFEVVTMKSRASATLESVIVGGGVVVVVVITVGDSMLRHGRDVHPAWVNVVTAALTLKSFGGSGDES